MIRSSSSGFRPTLTSTSSPAARRILIPSSERSSETSTLAAMAVSLGLSARERAHRRADPPAELDLRPQLGQAALHRGDGDDDVVLVVVAEVGDPEDLPLGLVLPAHQGDAVLVPEQLHQLVGVDPV